EDAALRCSSSSPFSTRIKSPGRKTTKGSQGSVTNYKRAIVNGKAKMVEVEDVGLV
ncbi:hypothetical protein Tco_0665763, partial [Tanacetum coccineum]